MIRNLGTRWSWVVSVTTGRFSRTEHFQLHIEPEVHEAVQTIWWSECVLFLLK